MTIALGIIETLGFPAVVAAANTMIKSADITLVGYERIGNGRVSVTIVGDAVEVEIALGAGIEIAQRVNGGEVLSTEIIEEPDPTLADILPLNFTVEAPEVAQDKEGAVV